MPCLYCRDSLRETACWLSASPQGGRGLAGISTWGVSWQIPEEEACDHESWQSDMKTLHTTLFGNTFTYFNIFIFPGEEAEVTSPSPIFTQRNWVSEKLSEWPRVTRWKLATFQVDTDPQSYSEGQSLERLNLSTLTFSILGGYFQRTMGIC